jgi:hypothetical protein
MNILELLNYICPSAVSCAPSKLAGVGFASAFSRLQNVSLATGAVGWAIDDGLLLT